MATSTVMRDSGNRVRTARLLFFSTLVLGVSAGTALIALALQSLASNREPVPAIERFDALQAPLTWLVPLVFALLLIQGQRCYAKNKSSAMPLVLAWLYFASFTIMDYVWLSSRAFQYTKDTNTWQGGSSVAPLLGGALVALSALAVLFCFALARRQRLRSR